MGRAIDMEKDIDLLKKDIAQLKTAFDGLASTVEMLQNTAPARKNVDLHEAESIKPNKKRKTEKKVVEETEV